MCMYQVRKMGAIIECNEYDSISRAENVNSNKWDTMPIWQSGADRRHVQLFSVSGSILSA